MITFKRLRYFTKKMISLHYTESRLQRVLLQRTDSFASKSLTETLKSSVTTSTRLHRINSFVVVIGTPTLKTTFRIPSNILVSHANITV